MTRNLVIGFVLAVLGVAALSYVAASLFTM